MRRKYSYLKVYLNNEALKNSAPLVLDMPGFDSQATPMPFWNI